MNICILGSGAYGIALASIMNKNKHTIKMWTHDEEECKILDKERISKKLEGYKIPKNLSFTTSLENAVKDAELIVVAVPAFAFDSVSKDLSKYLVKTKQHVLIATKGIEQNTCLFLVDVLKKYNNTKNYAVISGPTFASDIIKEVPIGFALGVRNKTTKDIVIKALKNDKTKLRPTRDIVGVELCGAVKNVLAIASGILGGMKVEDSTVALFLTESLNDVKHLIKALGGYKKSILSFAGFGDIFMTCTSTTSRNYSFGYLIGKGASKEEIDKYLETTTVEGMYTLKSIYKLVKNKKVKMPIIDLIYNIVLKDKNKEELLKFLIEKE